MNRRLLLRSALALAASSFVAACGAQHAGRGRRTVRLLSDPFALGVASGEPSTDGFVIWTRLLIDEPADAVQVSYEVAVDAAFKKTVRRGTTAALAELAYSLHIVIEGLQPGRDYWYRFHCSGSVSPTGRSRTIPATPSRLRAALVSCQHWEHGYFSAYADIIEQDPDVVLHVGDYIYEKSFGEGPMARRFPSAEPRTLQEYRARYALYRSDPHLRDAHAAVPFVATWDDHEVQNDYAGSESALGESPDAFHARRAAAYRAYFEHMPLRPQSLVAGGEVQLFRTLRWPGLATLYVLDTRQYRSVQPCSAGSSKQGHPIDRCSEVDAPSRTMLGTPQEQWLAQNLAAETSPWSVLVQQTLFAPMQLRGGTLWSDFWDAYASSRRTVLGALSQRPVQNALILGGDLHSFWVNDVHARPLDDRSAVIATEVITSCLASRNGPPSLLDDVRLRNAHVKHLDNSHSGYALLDIHASHTSIELRAVVNLLDRQSRTRKLETFVVENGRPGAVKQTADDLAHL